MKIWLYLFASSLAVLTLGCGDDPTPASTCNDIDQAACDRIIECYTAEELMMAAAPTTVQGCVDERRSTRLDVTGFACDEFTETRSNCMSGQRYNADTASLCTDNISSATCEGFRADQSPGECDSVCEAAVQ